MGPCTSRTYRVLREEPLQTLGVPPARGPKWERMGPQKRKQGEELSNLDI